MIVNHDIRGMQAHAKLTLISSGKNALAKRISNPKPIQEQAKTPFTGLTNDMRGRDGQGYAVCKSFNEKQKKNDITSSRLANPNPKFEQYPQPKKRVFNSSLNIKPSEIDMLSKLKNDNAKLLIMQLLKSKAIGIDTIQGDPLQKARLQTAYNTLCAKYESEYRKNSGTTFVLDEYVNEFKKEVHTIYGTSYDDLNKPANTDTLLQQILTEIQTNNAVLNYVFQPPPTATDIAGSSPSRAGVVDLVPDDEDDNQYDAIYNNPLFDKYNVGKRNELLAEVGNYVKVIEKKFEDSGIDIDDGGMDNYLIPVIIDLYNAHNLQPPIPNVNAHEFEQIIRTGDIKILEQIVPIVAILSRQSARTVHDYEQSDDDKSSDDEQQEVADAH